MLTSLFYPVLGRLLTVDDFGLLATITSILAVWVGGHSSHTMEALLVLFVLFHTSAYIASFVMTRR